MCVFEGTGIYCASTQVVLFELSTSSTGMDSGWSYQGSSLFHTSRIFTVTDLTTTIYPLVYSSTITGTPSILNYNVQCEDLVTVSNIRYTPA